MKKRKVNPIELEARAFDKIVAQRIQKGFVPDVGSKKSNLFLYNNPWRYYFTKQISVKKKINFVLNHCKKNQKVLDVGCGLGTLSFELAKKKIFSTGIDISKKSIFFANFFKNKLLSKNNASYINFLQTDLFKINEKKKFDVIIFFKTFHHLGNINKVLHKILKILKQNGKLILVEPLRSEFKFENAVYAYVLRFLSNTWINQQKKMRKIGKNDIKKGIHNIYNEYHYITNKKKGFDQSPMDNSINDPKRLIGLIKKKFKINQHYFTDSFKDKLIGGLRGKRYKQYSTFFDHFDEILIENKILNGTVLHLVATKK